MGQYSVERKETTVVVLGSYFIRLLLFVSKGQYTEFEFSVRTMGIFQDPPKSHHPAPASAP